MIQHVVNALATYRITRILNSEDGPADIAGMFRDIVGIEYTEAGAAYADNVIGRAVACPLCLSVWVGWAIAFATKTRAPFISGLAYSGVATVLFLWEIDNG